MKKILLLFFILPVFANAQIINTVFGPNDWLNCTGGGSCIAVDNSGNYYISNECHNAVYKVTASGIITQIAGNSGYGYNGDGGPATDASLYNPMGVAVDNSGNVYIADMSNERIRKINTSGIITTVAGSAGIIAGVGGFSGDGGQATAAQLSQPAGVFVDNAGNIYIADADNRRIRMVNTAGVINTEVGGGSSLGDGGLAINAQLFEPISVTFDAVGNMYICDGYSGNRIRKVNTSGIITTIAGTGIAGYNDDEIAAVSAELNIPRGIAVDAYGNVYIADNGNVRVRRVDTNGIINAIAGNGVGGFSGDGSFSYLAQIGGGNIAMDAAGNLIIGDLGNSRIRSVNNPQAFIPEEIHTLINTNNSINISPNPAQSELTITSTNKITNIVVTNLLGQAIYTHEYNNEKVEIDVAGLPAGIYLVKINGSEVKKFVKQ